MPRLKPPPEKKAFAPVEPDTLPDEPIEIDLAEDDSGHIEVDLAKQLPEETEKPEPRRAAPAPEPKPESEPEDDPLKKALEAQQRAEALQRDAERHRDEAIRRERERGQELERERGEREDAEYNSVLTAIAAEQSSVDKAESDYAAFAQAGDWANAGKAQKVMAIASARLDRLEDGKRAFETRRETAKVAPKPQERPALQAAPDLELRIGALGVPENAKAWLRTHPELITDTAKTENLGSAHQYLVNNKKVPAFSQAYFDALDVEFGFKAAPAPAPRDPEPQPQPRRSIQVSAPVSRDAPSPSGKRASDNKMTLTPEEVDIARRSIVDRPDMPALTNAQKEYIYAQNKRRYAQMKANGSYSEQKG